MASGSYAFPNHCPFSASSNRQPLRVSAACATADVAPARSASLYQVLGVEAGATSQEIKSAYRRLARVLHPDVVSPHSSPDEFIRVQAAYATLSDPQKRAAYDGSLHRRIPISAAAYRGGYSPVLRRKRSWETDQCW